MTRFYSLSTWKVFLALLCLSLHSQGHASANDNHDAVIRSCAVVFPRVQKPFLFKLSYGGKFSLLMGSVGGGAPLEIMPDFFHEALNEAETFVTVADSNSANIYAMFAKWAESRKAGLIAADSLEQKLDSGIRALYRNYLSYLEIENPEFKPYFTPPIAHFYLDRALALVTLIHEDYQIDEKLRDFLEHHPQVSIPALQAFLHLRDRITTHANSKNARVISLLTPKQTRELLTDLDTEDSVADKVRTIAKLEQSGLMQPRYYDGDLKAWHRFADLTMRLSPAQVWARRAMIQSWVGQIKRIHGTAYRPFFNIDMGYLAGPGLLRALEEQNFEVKQIETREEWEEFKNSAR